MDRTEDITRLLDAYADGNQDALDRLFPLVYEELRRVAHNRLRGERDDHTLNTTALVHEAYLKLIDLNRIQWKSRAHFFAIAAQAMRNILVDYAVRRKAQKRGGGQAALTLDEALIPSDDQVEVFIALDEALTQLAELDPRQARVVECRFFGGMTIDETAEALGVSAPTVNRDWATARAWLRRALQ